MYRAFESLRGLIFFKMYLSMTKLFSKLLSCLMGGPNILIGE